MNTLVIVCPNLCVNIYAHLDIHMHMHVHIYICVRVYMHFYEYSSTDETTFFKGEGKQKQIPEIPFESFLDYY